LSKGHPETKVVPKLIELCLVASRYRAALQYAEPFLERHPTDAHLRTVVGSVHLALGEYAMARSALEEAVRTDSNQKFAYYLLGVIARDHDHAVTPARDRFTKYLNLEPLGRHASEARAYLAETENMRPLHSQNRRERKAL
jgi:tetratricopeptide (TPR) repeat protein